MFIAASFTTNGKNNPSLPKNECDGRCKMQRKAVQMEILLFGLNQKGVESDIHMNEPWSHYKSVWSPGAKTRIQKEHCVICCGMTI